jgi:hypothetical protein
MTEVQGNGINDSDNVVAWPKWAAWVRNTSLTREMRIWPVWYGGDIGRGTGSMNSVYKQQNKASIVTGKMRNGNIEGIAAKSRHQQYRPEYD